MIQQPAMLLLAALASAMPLEDRDDSATENAPAATLTGTVVCGDSDQAPENFGVFLRSIDSREVHALRGEGGRFLGAVTPGRYEVALVAPGHDIFCRTITVSEGDRNTLRGVRLRAGSARLAIELRDVAGAPLAGHRVHLVRVFSPMPVAVPEGPVTPLSLGDARVEDEADTETADEQGRVTFADVPSGPTALVVEPPAGVPWPAQYLVVSQGEVREMVLLQEKLCTLAIRLSDGQGQILIPELIQVERESDGAGLHVTCSANFCCDALEATPLAPIGPVPFPRLSRHYHVWVPGPGTDDDSVLLAGLTPGPWRVKVRVGGQFLTATSVEMVGPITQIALDLPAPSSISPNVPTMVDAR